MTCSNLQVWNKARFVLAHVTSAVGFIHPSLIIIPDVNLVYCIQPLFEGIRIPLKRKPHVDLKGIPSLLTRHTSFLFSNSPQSQLLPRSQMFPNSPPLPLNLLFALCLCSFSHKEVDSISPPLEAGTNLFGPTEHKVIRCQFWAWALQTSALSSTPHRVCSSQLHSPIC